MSGEQKRTKAQEERDAALLKSLTGREMDKDQVADMVEGIVGMLGRVSGHTGFMMPRPSTLAQQNQHVKKEVQKHLKHVSDKLAEAASSNSVECIRSDESFTEWLERDSCRLKNFHEELKFARQTMDLAAEHDDYELGLSAVNKAIKISTLHSKKDTELLSGLYWVQATLYAITDRMEEAKSSLQQCVKLVNPDDPENSETYAELAKQLEETHNKALEARSK